MSVTIRKWLFLALLLPCLAFGQALNFITMDQEPHHHLAFKNDYVKVFLVAVNPGDSIQMHSHDRDTVAIAIGEQAVTVGFPDKPSVHQTNPDGQLRLQKTGYVHSTAVDPGTVYRTVAVELMQNQEDSHNLCAAVMAGQPLDCLDTKNPLTSSKFVKEPEFQSNQTRIQLVHVMPGESVHVGSAEFNLLIVALDAEILMPPSGNAAVKNLRPGDFFWINKGEPYRAMKNPAKSEARFVEFEFTPVAGTPK